MTESNIRELAQLVMEAAEREKAAIIAVRVASETCNRITGEKLKVIDAFATAAGILKLFSSEDNIRIAHLLLQYGGAEKAQEVSHDNTV